MGVTSLKKKKKIFGLVFLASICVLAAINIQWPMLSVESPPKTIGDSIDPNQPPMPPPKAANGHGLSVAVVVSVISLLTSLTSLIGFFSATILAWRKEKREALSTELEIAKKELEIEKLRKELAKSEGKNNENA